jgi:hypothetical protein
MRNLLINTDNREVTGLFAASDLGCRKLEEKFRMNLNLSVEGCLQPLLL